MAYGNAMVLDMDMDTGMNEWEKIMDLADGDGRLKSESVVRLSVAYT